MHFLETHHQNNGLLFWWFLLAGMKHCEEDKSKGKILWEKNWQIINQYPSNNSSILCNFMLYLRVVLFISILVSRWDIFFISELGALCLSGYATMVFDISWVSLKFVWDNEASFTLLKISLSVHNCLWFIDSLLSNYHFFLIWPGKNSFWLDAKNSPTYRVF